MSNRCDIQLPLIARVRHSVRNLEALTHSLVDGSASWPHELIAEPITINEHATIHPQLTQTPIVAVCILPRSN